jgi:hypothetical protein
MFRNCDSFCCKGDRHCSQFWSFVTPGISVTRRPLCHRGGWSRYPWNRRLEGRHPSGRFVQHKNILPPQRIEPRYLSWLDCILVTTLTELFRVPFLQHTSHYTDWAIPGPLFFQHKHQYAVSLLSISSVHKAVCADTLWCWHRVSQMECELQQAGMLSVTD